MASNKDEQIQFGQRVYESNCLACHQAGGVGIPRAFPPLAASDFLNKETVFIVKGEKDVDNLWRGGLSATCNPMGAGKWRPEYNKFFTGKNVVIIPDDDNAGWVHAQQVAVSLYESELYKSIKIIV